MFLAVDLWIRTTIGSTTIAALPIRRNKASHRVLKLWIRRKIKEFCEGVSLKGPTLERPRLMAQASQQPVQRPLRFTPDEQETDPKLPSKVDVNWALLEQAKNSYTVANPFLIL